MPSGMGSPVHLVVQDGAGGLNEAWVGANWTLVMSRHWKIMTLRGGHSQAAYMMAKRPSDWRTMRADVLDAYVVGVLACTDRQELMKEVRRAMRCGLRVHGWLSPADIVVSRRWRRLFRSTYGRQGIEATLDLLMMTGVMYLGLSSGRRR